MVLLAYLFNFACIYICTAVYKVNIKNSIIIRDVKENSCLLREIALKKHITAFQLTLEKKKEKASIHLQLIEAIKNPL